jgi:hypothetical protein
MKNSVWTLEFEIQILKTISNGKTPNMKVVDLEKLWNFVVDKFLIWIRLDPRNMIYTRCSIIWVQWKSDMNAYECVV